MNIRVCSKTRSSELDPVPLRRVQINANGVLIELSCTDEPLTVALMVKVANAITTGLRKAGMPAEVQSC